ncbi:MAG: hypothetical protein LBS74_01700 [Oscillospiraceae bacterium]|jgi:hypothetical protein|nr:hypothetical protein [Oscillospiraceae bacterium]
MPRAEKHAKRIKIQGRMSEFSGKYPQITGKENDMDSISDKAIKNLEKIFAFFGDKYDKILYND